MKKLFTFLCFLSTFSMGAQVDFNAKDFVNPYDGVFRPGSNLDYYPNWRTKELGSLAGGDPSEGIMGVGAKTLRPVLAESVLEVFGYDVVVDEFEHFRSLGMDEFTAVLAFPVDWHKDYTEYCPGTPSNLFANLHTPIWDGGANGTPYNDENYFAAYVYKTVTTYDEYVKFWEIWNEPGFDYTGNKGWRGPGDPQGNWWDNDPDPCDYILQAPIENYVRTLRIAYEVIKTLSPNDYVVTAGFGYQSFADAVLRNTDNPDGGSVTAEYPEGGGAYIDIMGLHNYPHIDGTTRLSNIEFFERHSDRAAEGLIYRRDFFAEIFANYGYDGVTYPKKLTLCTEMNTPREFDGNDDGRYFAGTTAQRNYIMKTFVTAITNDVINFHVYSIGDNPGSGLGFDKMGLYEDLSVVDPGEEKINEEGIAMKTTSDMLWGTVYDDDRTAALNAPDGVEAHAFLRPDGRYVYMLWARTTIDNSEFADKNYSFPGSFEYNTLERRNWNYAVTNETSQENASGIDLDATPFFLIEPSTNNGSFVSINCPADISFEISASSNGIDLTYNNPTTSTNCPSGDVTLTRTAGPASGSTFGIGVTTVTYRVTNDCGQSAFCSFTVNITQGDAEPPSGTYCTSASMEPWQEYITNVAFQEINNASGKCDTDCGYGDFTNLMANISAGESYGITLTPGISWAGQDADLFWRVWIDLNGDGDFTDANEKVLEMYGGRDAVSNTINIPGNTSEGTTRMRIATKKGGYADPCEIFLKGEVEDYSVAIAEGNMGCTQTGQACDDGDDCTTGDVFNGDCDCVGTFQDSDGDGVCNAEDECPGFDDNEDENNNGVPDGCGGPLSEDYCDASSDQPWEQYIRQVEVGDINNLSGKCDNGCGYSDFTNISTELVIGDLYDIALTAKYSFENHDEYWSAWIDFDGDNNFSADELIISRFTADLGYGIITHTVENVFSVPANAQPGPVRMRVALSRGGFPTACGDFAFGEVEDYTINLTGGNNTSGIISNNNANLREETTVDFANLRLYPNPTVNAITIDLTSYEQMEGIVKIQDQMGRILVSFPLASLSGARTEIDLSDLTSGLYFLTVQPKKGKLTSKRFTVISK